MTAPSAPTQSQASARVAPLAKAISFLGCVLTLHASPAAAETRRPVPPSRDARHAGPPWSEVRESRSAPFTSARVSRLPFRLSDHPAIHPGRNGAGVPQRLFPRLPDIQQERRLRQDAMARHPAGKAATTSDRNAAGRGSDAAMAEGHAMSRTGTERSLSKRGPISKARSQQLSTPEPRRSYTVRRGDSLWSIAERTSGTQDPASIHALTQRIYRMNRAIVGPDPDLILPGQILTLPADPDR